MWQPSFDYSLTNSGNLTAARGSSASNKITATLLSGASQAINFTVSGLPPGATATFRNNLNSCIPTCSTLLTIATAGTTPTGTFRIMVTGTPLTTSTSFDLTVVAVSTPLLSVTPTSSVDFGNVNVGRITDINAFIVENTGFGNLIGTASTNAPSYSIVSGGSYNLAAGQSQSVVVRFTPTSAGTFSGNVVFTGGGGASRPVAGIGVP
jgi:hypothetical protein